MFAAHIVATSPTVDGTDFPVFFWPAHLALAVATHGAGAINWTVFAVLTPAQTAHAIPAGHGQNCFRTRNFHDSGVRDQNLIAGQCIGYRQQVGSRTGLD